MSHFTIETRLNVLVGALLVLSLVANLLVIVLSAGPRIRAENASTLSLARLTVDRALADLAGSANAQRDLAGLVERLSSLRHVRVHLLGPAQSSAEIRSSPDDGLAVVSFLLPIAQTAVELPAVVNGVDYGRLVVVTDPSDELAEIGESLVSTLVGGLVVIVALFALTRLAVRQALRPMATLSAALSQIERGDFGVQLPREASPEFAVMSANVAALAAALKRTSAENRRLSQELVSIEDQERRDLAAELHDEFGPYLFAIRAGASTLLAESERDTAPGAPARAKLCRALLEHTAAVQAVNRRVLQRLRPPALAEIGLAGALDGLVAHWRETHPDVAIAIAIDVPPVKLDQITELTVYRVVQEGLTNALRHAGATTIEVAVGHPRPEVLSVSVSDDGHGMEKGAAPGFGLSAMRDRVLALGGSLELLPAHRIEPTKATTSPSLGGARSEIGVGGAQPQGLTLKIELPLKMDAPAPAT